MRILITGAPGMLGQDVCRAANVSGHDVLPLGMGELDITDPSAVDGTVSRLRPEVIVNCAAWTDVDGAESSPEEAHAVNAQGAENVASAAAAAGAWTIQLSTDYVFDGTKREPYVESDSPAPLSVYGRSKLEGELAVARAAPASHTVVRSSWLFGANGSCFPATILRVARERDQLTVVDDQVGCPTFTGHLAGALLELAGRRVLGIVHVAGAGSCSWYELASEIIAASGLNCEVEPGLTADLGRPAARPGYSVLGSERSPDAPQLPHWREGLAEYLAVGARA